MMELAYAYRDKYQFAMTTERDGANDLRYVPRRLILFLEYSFIFSYDNIISCLSFTLSSFYLFLRSHCLFFLLFHVVLTSSCDHIVSSCFAIVIVAFFVFDDS